MLEIPKILTIILQKHFKIAMQLYQLYYHVTSAIKYIRTTELVMQNERKHGRSRYNFLFIFKEVLGDTVFEVKHFLPGSHLTRVIWTSAINDLFRSVMLGTNFSISISIFSCMSLNSNAVVFCYEFRLYYVTTNLNFARKLVNN